MRLPRPKRPRNDNGIGNPSSSCGLRRDRRSMRINEPCHSDGRAKHENENAWTENLSTLRN
ncbi:MAG: hypothetical protein ACYC3B_03590 [Sedimentisphaerales bacterium]